MEGAVVKKLKTMSAHQVAVAGEAFAAGVLAHAGCDVLVQYGANLPEYDLVATKAGKFLKVSVKGSQDGGWGLIQKYKSGRTYVEAIETWLSKQRPEITYCFVQFAGVAVGQGPRVYFATAAEVAAFLKASRRGDGNTILYEDYSYSRGRGGGTTDRLPAAWHASAGRIDALLETAAPQAAPSRHRSAP